MSHYGAKHTPEAMEWAFAVLVDYSIEQVERALVLHLRDPERGKYAPKPADIVAAMGGRADGHPGAEEAWGVILRIALDEDASGLYSEPMRVAWGACMPQLDVGDKIGARMAFLEKYTSEVAHARAAGIPAKFTLSRGRCPEKLKAVLDDGLRTGQISHKTRNSLLPAIDGPAGSFEALIEKQGASDNAVAMDALAKIRAMIQGPPKWHADNEERRAMEKQREAEDREECLRLKREHMAEWPEERIKQTIETIAGQYAASFGPVRSEEVVG